ncbi:DUF2169 family type VI secretion system accessory protein [Inquilinus sp. CA228]|uniref:DUF2169 family type VI secretion system accessory protein n=1 Tax=Inquilinus sp. CA228 TaxID=3455609 RepID=UPI003F8D4AD5
MITNAQSPLQIASIVGRYRRDDYLLTVIATMRARLVPGAACVPLPEEDQPVPGGLQSHEDGDGGSPVYGGDFAPHKPRADFTLLGTCHAPTGRPVTSLDVTIGLGDWRKSMRVFGDSNWVRDVAGGIAVSDPRPFQSMPLRYEKSFGGVTSRHNPWGKGFGAIGTEPGSRLPVANIHPQDALHTAPDQDRPPAGFGPLAPEMEARGRLRGTHDAHWLYHRRPLPPEDFDWGFYNVAPRDQQFEGFLRGDERLFFANLHPEHPAFDAMLPGLRVRTFIIRAGREASGEGRYEEIATVLDSVHVDSDAMTVDLTWRAATAVHDPRAKDMEQALVVGEPMAEAPKPAEAHFEALRQGAKPQWTPPPPPPAPQPLTPQQEAAAVQEIVNDIAALKLPPEVLARLRTARTGAELHRLAQVEAEAMMAKAFPDDAPGDGNA